MQRLRIVETIIWFKLQLPESHTYVMTDAHQFKHGLLRRLLLYVAISQLALISFSCSRDKNRNSPSYSGDTAAITSGWYIPIILSMDTMQETQKAVFITKKIQELKNLRNNVEQEMILNFFRARDYEIRGQTDSAMQTYSAMDSSLGNKEIKHLRAYKLLDLELGRTTVDGSFMNKLLNATHAAEEDKSRFVYQFYDLVAKAYYQNRNAKKSMEYANLYYQNHPLQYHPHIQQRYYDISFLLASRMNDAEKMKIFNRNARLLAEQIGDSTAIVRSFDNEAQVYARQKQYAKALNSSRKYFNFLKQRNGLNEVVYNNLANSFLLAREVDSAIHYFKAGVKIMETRPLNQKTPLCYSGLRDAYILKNDYRNALQSADSAFTIQLRNIKSIEETKIAEIQEKYQAEKKDRSIAELKSINLLNNKIINQQRWLFAGLLFIGLGVLSFLFIFQRQRLLKSKNELLKAENRRLNAEQKMLQSQLNPHFIFNAIANLQSLIGTGEKALSLSYLSSFSQLLRNILEQSRKDLISLEEEIETLKNYLRLQQMRFHNAFDFRFNIDETIDTESVLIPPMLLQPFLENAVEHGFRNIDYKGMVATTILLKDGQLHIEIDDNGSGLKPHDRSAKKSLSGIILKERLKTLFPDSNEADFKVVDKKNYGRDGMLIKITLPAINES